MPPSKPKLADNLTHEESNGPRRKKNITLFQSIGMGSLAGAIEVAIDHPLWSIKTRLQRGDPFTLKPRLLYRGILANASSMVPVTALQVTLNHSVHRFVFKDHPALTHTQKISAAFVAGVGSSFVSCPTEMIMTHQGKSGESYKNTIHQLIKRGGIRYLWTALPATSIREGVFTTFFLAVTPILKQNILSHCENDYTASLVAGIGAGLGAAVVSQSVDTIKTRQQITGEAFVQSVKELYASRGLMGFFKGGLPRAFNVMSAVTIMGYVNEKIENALHQHPHDDLPAEKNMQLVKK